jgi:AcrR family transcriptional regulator
MLYYAGVARRRLHSDEVILDAARALLIQGGPEAATTAAISTTSGAPVGSLYHRFGSRTQLFAEVWLRTVGRFQDGLLAAAATGSVIERALAVADWSVEFAVRHPDDARLLLQARREDLLGDADLPAQTRQALTALNDPVTELLHQLAVDLFKAATPERLELLAIAVVDVPYAIVRRHLRHGTSPRTHRRLIASTVRTLLEPPPGRGEA